jgi:hypothetical protein
MLTNLCFQRLGKAPMRAGLYPRRLSHVCGLFTALSRAKSIFNTFSGSPVKRGIKLRYQQPQIDHQPCMAILGHHFIPSELLTGPFW